MKKENKKTTHKKRKSLWATWVPQDPGEDFGQAADTKPVSTTVVSPDVGYKDAIHNIASSLIHRVFEATKTAGGMALADTEGTVSLPCTSDGCWLRYVLDEKKGMKQKQSLQEMLL